MNAKRFELVQSDKAPFWSARSSLGDAPEIRDASQLWKVAEEYFEWVENNPLTIDKVCTYRGKSEIRKMDRSRPMTIAGFCLFIGISSDRFEWMRLNSRFSETIQRIEDVFYAQKFTGALCGQFNAAFVARDLGISEKKEVVNSDGAEFVESRQLSAHELAVAMFNLVSEGQKEKARAGKALDEIETKQEQSSKQVIADE